MLPLPEEPAPAVAGRPVAPARPGRGQAEARMRDDWRLMLVIAAFCLVYATVGVRMGMMALSDPEEPRLSQGSQGSKPVRGAIADRNGAILAANLPAWSLYARPKELTDPAGTATEVAKILGKPVAEVLASFASPKKFVWVQRPITPRQKAAIHDLGRPGLYFGPRDVRIYPAGRPTAHLVGAVRAAEEGVSFARYAGVAGVEQVMDARLRDPERAGEPVRLSIDLGAQTALREVLAAGMRRFTAKGAAAVIMDVETGEILAMVSLPDFDPNKRPNEIYADQGDDPRFNRAAQGVYELGSTFKVLTAAVALETGVAAPETLIETGEAFYHGRRRIRDMHKMPDVMSLTEIVVRSSNVGSAKLVLRVGTPRFREYLKKLGLLSKTGLELGEARQAVPLLPQRWTDLSTITMSYGHGISVSPVHLAAAYATLANDGWPVSPTLLAGAEAPERREGDRVFSARVSRQMAQILRETVRNGTGRRADVPGYEVGGKTGTADKPRPRAEGGGYYRDRVIATFASIFPVSAPRYALIVSLDEPTNREGSRPVREASRTAVPVAGEVIRRVAPLLGLRPLPMALPPADATLTAFADGTAREP